MRTVNFGAALRGSGAPATGDFHGVESGQVYIDTANQVIYQNIGSDQVPRWAAEGNVDAVFDAVKKLDGDYLLRFDGKRLLLIG